MSLAGQELTNILRNPKVHYIGTRTWYSAPSWARCIESIPSHPISWHSVLILSYHLGLGFLVSPVPSGYPAKTLYAFIVSSLLCVCVCVCVGQMPLTSALGQLSCLPPEHHSLKTADPWHHLAMQGTSTSVISITHIQWIPVFTRIFHPLPHQLHWCNWRCILAVAAHWETLTHTSIPACRAIYIHLQGFSCCFCLSAARSPLGSLASPICWPLQGM